MEILLEELYKTDLQLDRFRTRKLQIDNGSYQINGITQSGKTQLAKAYLLGHRKNSYLYIDCNDIRLDIEQLNKHLNPFCQKNRIDILVLDNYNPDILFPNVSQLLVLSEIHYNIPELATLHLYPLDYEEFLAFEHKYDSSALNHFIQLGSLAVMHKVASDERHLFLQKQFSYALGDMAFDIVTLCTKFATQKLSPFTIYERLKLKRKISKDKLYASFASLRERGYIHQLAKFAHPKAVKKLYLCDTALQSALSVDKNFGRLFENMVFLELLKHKKEIFYDEGVDFYIPKNNEVLLCKPFADEKRVFKKLEDLEAFLFTHSITRVTVITMNKEGSLAHPLCEVEIIPFDLWALSE